MAKEVHPCCSAAITGLKMFIHVVLLPLQGVITARIHTQGAALGYMLLPFQGVYSNYAF